MIVISMIDLYDLSCVLGIIYLQFYNEFLFRNIQKLSKTFSETKTIQPRNTLAFRVKALSKGEGGVSGGGVPFPSSPPFPPFPPLFPLPFPFLCRFPFAFP